ncbi:Uncharacterised protein [Mycobacteroides abscessus subsp. abscessus]|nr:Uncharacterised protein [Mycobacteroides abscessus subsp. abscessus]
MHACAIVADRRGEFVGGHRRVDDEQHGFERRTQAGVVENWFGVCLVDDHVADVECRLLGCNALGRVGVGAA